MSTLLRVVHSQGIKNRLTFLAKSTTVKVHDVAKRLVSSTSKKNDNVSDLPYPVQKPWISYGFDYKNKEVDRHKMHLTTFVCVTIGLVLHAFILGYMPDVTMKDWALREAFLQLRYREENGLPLVNPNVIDPSKVILPTDEELGDTEIII
ncbi:PREDICTED: NADH dehydrogenase [ubiquinone] 1 beta subcomplex subunit 11, mitochondrial [Dufourea novaeangliae]|uniref:NADH dehydrogenase [ubiquinone] 1 beta subcomplex subunit 11, mitochondrial n=1 Tax=Dufourea novaeangliae TaxID=178035 RepID=A0A154NZ72_DUFNO|nr:PREDICTED: NADH dehydrogenase [ubiquinone] 1 beta subcomplex subunit 11, mitochondrial [Dufourea novaeangliae]KZC04976.1 NADH dehydrogenase [ubiquinone] 1 beta subcomplex subunit 11, mitochondrial [Dufourea novaeangliae]